MGRLALPVPGDKVSSLELFDESFYAVMPERHPLAARETIRLSDLSKEPFLLLKEGHCFRDSVISACRRSRMKPNGVFESGQCATNRAVVLAGSGGSAR